MGDCQKCDLRVAFDCTVRLTFVGSKVTSDAGLLAYRELDEALGLTATAGKRLEDSRTGRNTRHALLPLIRQSIYSRLAGYEAVNDAERLCRPGDAAHRGWPRQPTVEDDRVEQRTRTVRDGDAWQPEEPHDSHESAGRVGRFSIASFRLANH
jgi:hypothetical protein